MIRKNTFLKGGLSSSSTIREGHGYSLKILHQCRQRVKTKIQKVLGANSNVSRSYSGKTGWIGGGGGAFCPPPSPSIEPLLSDIRPLFRQLSYKIKDIIIDVKSLTKLYKSDKFASENQEDNCFNFIFPIPKETANFFWKLIWLKLPLSKLRITIKGSLG